MAVLTARNLLAVTAALAVLTVGCGHESQSATYAGPEGWSVVVDDAEGDYLQILVTDGTFEFVVPKPYLRRKQLSVEWSSDVSVLWLSNTDIGSTAYDLRNAPDVVAMTCGSDPDRQSIDELRPASVPKCP